MTPSEVLAFPHGTSVRVKWGPIGPGPRRCDGLLTRVPCGCVFEWGDGATVQLSQTDIEAGKAGSWLSHVNVNDPDYQPTCPEKKTAGITFSASIPADHEATGEFRLPDPTVDTYIHHDGVTVVYPAPRGHAAPKGPRIILRKKLTVKERLENLRELVVMLPATSVDVRDKILTEIVEIQKIA